MNDVGVVVIGRNEGPRLINCLQAVRATGVPCVYVDSGSTDGSAEVARELIEHVVELNSSLAYTAARGRNAGFESLLQHHPHTGFVQFVDGDCILDEHWLARARRTLADNSDTAIVCGRLREQKPRESIFNELCDIEWNRPCGRIASCGGIFMIRVDAFRDVRGFNASLRSGEEPELCARLRHRGWSLIRVADPMAVHDAAMTRFGQWWSRAIRSGRSAMEAVWRSQPRPETHDVRRVVSILAWTVALPALAIGMLWITGGWSLLLFGAYPLQWLRLWWKHHKHMNLPPRTSVIGATFTFVAKAAELIGLIQVTATLLAGPRPVNVKSH